MRTLRQWGMLAIVLAAFCALLAAACSDDPPEAQERVAQTAPQPTAEAQVQQMAEAQAQPAAEQPAPEQSVRATPIGGDPAEHCDGLPTQTIVVTPQSFTDDERLVRVITSPSRECTVTLTLTLNGDPNPNTSCTIIYQGPLPSVLKADRAAELHAAGDEDRPPSIFGAYEGDCDWLDADFGTSISQTPALSAPAPGCTGIDSLSLTVNAETFNERGRADIVALVPETRCYVFLTAVQNPDRAEPFQFGPDQECVIRHSRAPQGDCAGITFWSGRGRGGVWTQAEAEAVVAQVSAD